MISDCFGGVSDTSQRRDQDGGLSILTYLKRNPPYIYLYQTFISSRVRDSRQPGTTRREEYLIVNVHETRS